MQQAYELHSGRRSIGVREAPTAQVALLEHVRSLGCRDDEVMRVGVDSIAWRGAVFKAVAVSTSDATRN